MSIKVKAVNLIIRKVARSQSYPPVYSRLYSNSLRVLATSSYHFCKLLLIISSLFIIFYYLSVKKYKGVLMCFCCMSFCRT